MADGGSRRVCASCVVPVELKKVDRNRREKRGERSAMQCENTKMSDSRKEAGFGCISITVKSQKQDAELEDQGVIWSRVVLQTSQCFKLC